MLASHMRHVSFAFVAHDEIRPRFIHSTLNPLLVDQALGASTEMDVFSRAACQHTAPVIFGIEDMPTSPVTRLLANEGLQSVVVMPLRLHTGHLGVIYLCSTLPRSELQGRLLPLTGDLALVCIQFGQRLGELHFRHDDISVEARQALALLAQGLDFPEIAFGMASTPRRVRYLIERLRARLGAANKSHLIHIAHKTGLL